MYLWHLECMALSWLIGGSVAYAWGYRVTPHDAKSQHTGRTLLGKCLLQLVFLPYIHLALYLYPGDIKQESLVNKLVLTILLLFLYMTAVGGGMILGSIHRRAKWQQLKDASERRRPRKSKRHR